MEVYQKKTNLQILINIFLGGKKKGFIPLYILLHLFTDDDIWYKFDIFDVLKMN